MWRTTRVPYEHGSVRAPSSVSLTGRWQELRLGTECAHSRRRLCGRCNNFRHGRTGFRHRIGGHQPIWADIRGTFKPTQIQSACDWCLEYNRHNQRNWVLPSGYNTRCDLLGHDQTVIGWQWARLTGNVRMQAIKLMTGTLALHKECDMPTSTCYRNCGIKPNFARPADVHAADNARNSMVHLERSCVQSSHHETAASQRHGRMGKDTHKGKM